MRRIQNMVAGCILLLLVASASSAQSRRGPSTPEERAIAVKSAAILEADPLGKGAKELRKQLTLWLIEVPDVSVHLCGAPLGSAIEKKYKYNAELVSQLLFSSAAYVIEHPDSALDRPRVGLAGVEGALRAYGAMVRADAKARHEFLDELLERQRADELSAYVAETWKAKCQR